MIIISGLISPPQVLIIQLPAMEESTGWIKSLSPQFQNVHEGTSVIYVGG